MDLEFIDHLKSFLADQGYGLANMKAQLTGNPYAEQYMEFRVIKCLSKEDIARIREKENE